MKLKEAEYNKFFKKDVLDYLDQKVKEPYNGHRDLMELMRNAMTSLPLIKEIEKDFIPSLEELAVSMVKDAFPIIEQEGIEIEAKIGTAGETEFEEDEIEPDNPEEADETTLDDQAKRRIINSLTQGASVRGSYIYNMMKDELDIIDERLFDSYNKLLKSTYGLYDLMIMTPDQAKQLAQTSGNTGAMGKVKVMIPKSKDGEEELEGKLKIKAVATTFPFLIHEIIKGLYEIIGLSGFTNPDKEYNTKIMNKVDTIFNELDDLKFGKYIYDAANKVLGDYTSDRDFDPRIREYFLQEIYKIEDSKEFISLIENIIMNRLTSSQKKWIQDAIRDIIDDLKYDDNPLDENKTNTHNIILNVNEIGLKRFKTVPTFKNLLHQNQLDSLKVGDNELTVNNSVWGTLQRMVDSDKNNMSVKKKLNEVKLIKGFEFKLIYPKFPPKKGDTLTTWLDKYELYISYSDKSKISGWSVKVYGLISLFVDNLEEWGEYISELKNQVSREFLKKVINKNIEKLKNHIQSYFDKYCGKDRIKVKLLIDQSVWIRYIVIRLIIPEQYKVFKMIPS